ncbi:MULTISPECIES: ABC transporter ATP-binding protein [Actinomyces]|uniref:ABC transporter ATP-binding protein n=1 Tax=Actinomyces marmotae TaxID=2737173 RepID=A0A6M8B4C0_9ACTO|nr:MULTISPECIES: ABC transporter ATP-binding protein [Actinomyces]QKD78896.1 ABC transporter ATP-binding protein [Actinomyces marmotae]
MPTQSTPTAPGPKGGPAATGHLELRDVVKVFSNRGKDVYAVHGVSLDIAPGEFVTLLGPSGCGKTTTLRMIAGFEDTTSGQVVLDGQNMVSLPPNKRPMSMVFQSYALFPHLSVRENIAYGLKLRRTKPEEIREQVEVALTSMNLNSLADRAPNELSGGQQQRVALARAMVMRPKVLLFDEPLSNLDAKLRVRMRLEIRRLQQRMGITSIYVTHDQAEAMTMSDRIVVMNAGRIEQVATPEEIYRRPASTFVADFIGRANFLAATARDVAAGRCSVRVLGATIQAACHEDVSSGGGVTVIVRPESVRLSPCGTAGGAAGSELIGAHGRVLSSVFYGDHVEYEVETEAGTILCVESDPEPASVHSEGDDVMVDIEASRAWVLPEATADGGQ